MCYRENVQWWYISIFTSYYLQRLWKCHTLKPISRMVFTQYGNRESNDMLIWTRSFTRFRLALSSERQANCECSQIVRPRQKKMNSQFCFSFIFWRLNYKAIRELRSIVHFIELIRRCRWVQKGSTEREKNLNGTWLIIFHQVAVMVKNLTVKKLMMWNRHSTDFTKIWLFLKNLFCKIE